MSDYDDEVQVPGMPQRQRTLAQITSRHQVRREGTGRERYSKESIGEGLSNEQSEIDQGREKHDLEL